MQELANASLCGSFLMSDARVLGTLGNHGNEVVPFFLKRPYQNKQGACQETSVVKVEFFPNVAQPKLEENLSKTCRLNFSS